MSTQRLERLIHARSLRTEQALRHLQATRAALEQAHALLRERQASLALQQTLRAQLLAGVVEHAGTHIAETLQRIERRRAHLDDRVAQLEHAAAEAGLREAAAATTHEAALAAWVAARNRQQRLSEHRESVLRAERRRSERRVERSTEERYSQPRSPRSGIAEGDRR